MTIRHPDYLRVPEESFLERLIRRTYFARAMSSVSPAAMKSTLQKYPQTRLLLIMIEDDV